MQSRLRGSMYCTSSKSHLFGTYIQDSIFSQHFQPISNSNYRKPLAELQARAAGSRPGALASWSIVPALALFGLDRFVLLLQLCSNQCLARSFCLTIRASQCGVVFLTRARQHETCRDMRQPHTHACTASNPACCWQITESRRAAGGALKCSSLLHMNRVPLCVLRKASNAESLLDPHSHTLCSATSHPVHSVRAAANALASGR